MKRLAQLIAGAGLLGMLAIAPVQAQPDNINFGYITGIAFPTFIISEDHGYFERENLNVEKVNLNGSGPISEALAAGNLDMGNSTPLSSILTTAKGGETIIVSAHEYSFTDQTGRSFEGAHIVVRAGEGIEDLPDLEGKRIAINDIGSSYTHFLRARLIELGMNPDSDVTIVPIPFSQMAGALLQEQVDAIIATSDGLHQARQHGEVEIIGNQSSLEGLDVGLTSVVAVNKQFLEEHRDLVVRFLRAELQARIWMATALEENDPAIKETVAEAMNYSPERNEAFWETRGGYYGKELDFVNLLDIPEHVVNRQIEVFKTTGLIPQNSTVSYDDVVDIGPLREAYESLGMKWDDAKHQ